MHFVWKIILSSMARDIYSHKYTKTKINSDDDLHLEKTLSMQSVLILSNLKSVFNKNLSHHYIPS